MKHFKIYLEFYFNIWVYFRLHEIEENMVGGERANDNELKERRQKKKRAAEKRSKVVAETNRSDDEENQILMRAYDNIQEELRVKTDALKKSKQKVRNEL